MLFAMPRKAEWWQHIPFALEQLRSSTLPVIDRAGLETLLNVHRRDAIRLMHRFGGYQAGRTFLIDRVQLIARLEHLISTDDYSHEKRRWVKLSDELDRSRHELQARAVVIPAPQETWRHHLQDLPSGIQIHPGKLEITFQGTVELLQSLLELAQAISNDFEKFQALLEQTDQTLV
jgi:hypothetical protein